MFICILLWSALTQLPLQMCHVYVHPLVFLNYLFLNDAETPGKGHAVSAVGFHTCQYQLVAGFLE